MKRTLLGMLAAAALSASAAAQSDQQPAQPTPPAAQPAQPTHAEQVQHWAEAALDSQLKNMKSSLKLTPDQETNWEPFESAVKDGGKARVLALQKEQSSGLSPMNRNLAKADRLAESQANLQKMVEAAKPLYASLNDAQKHKFITLGRMLVPERRQFAKEMRRLH